MVTPRTQFIGAGVAWAYASMMMKILVNFAVRVNKETPSFSINLH